MIDAILILMYVVVASALGTLAWAMVHRWQLHDRSADVVNGIPLRKLVTGVVVVLIALLLITFVLGSSAPILVNGKPYADVFWLKAADMFIRSSAFLLLVAVIAVICSNVRNVKSRR